MLRDSPLPKVAPLSMFEEANTKTNLPAQIDMMSQLSPYQFVLALADAGAHNMILYGLSLTRLRHGSSYDVFYIAKGGGSANKTQSLRWQFRVQGLVL